MKVFDGLHAFPWTNLSANNCNTYLAFRDRKILVDPGHEHLFAHVREGLNALSLSMEDIDLVLVTHAHPDHMEAARLFQVRGVPVALHGAETAFSRQMGPTALDAADLSRFEPDILLQAGDLRVGSMEFQVIHTPGHSPGSVSLYWPEMKALFPGDVLFEQSIGRTDLAGGDGEALKESISLLSQLDVEILLPGHGGIISGGSRVRANFEEIERIWFAYL